MIKNRELNFSNIEVAHDLSVEWVLSKLAQEQIFYAYFGEFVPYKKSYNSIFRKDKNASTGFYYSDSGKLKYKDLATGESWDCFAFVSHLYNISYFEAIKKVACDFGIIRCDSIPLERKSINNSVKFDKKSKEDRTIQIIPSSWLEKHARYWKQYEITKTELEKEHVYPIKDLYIDKHFISNKDNLLRFAYVVSVDKKEYIKVYTPYADKFKWISNIPLHIPFGMDTLNYDSETIIIAKSLKDLIVLKKFFPAVIATQNESEAALNKGMIEFLKKKFKKRVIIFDNDDIGKEACKKFNEKGFGYWNIPNEFIVQGIKDPSDFVAAYGVEKLKNLFKEKNLL